jgi:hypothetical protein
MCPSYLGILRRLRQDQDLKTRRLRCFGHVINLAAKAFLFGKDRVGNDPDLSDSENIDPSVDYRGYI